MHAESGGAQDVVLELGGPETGGVPAGGGVHLVSGGCRFTAEDGKIEFRVVQPQLLPSDVHREFFGPLADSLRGCFYPIGQDVTEPSSWAIFSVMAIMAR